MISSWQTLAVPQFARPFVLPAQRAGDPAQELPVPRRGSPPVEGRAHPAQVARVLVLYIAADYKARLPSTTFARIVHWPVLNVSAP